MNRMTTTTNAARAGLLRALMPIATAASCLAAGSVAHAADATARYGLIEIGAKGVKGYSFDLDRAAHEHACAQSEEAYLKCVDPQTIESANINPIEDREFADTTKAVEQLAADLGGKGVSPEHLYVVLSSSLAEKEARADRLDVLLKADTKLALKHPPDRVNADQEAIFGLRGALGILPDNVREKRAAQATLVDFGSGNIKGAYKDVRDEITFNVDFGTKTAATAIEGKRGSDSFGAAAEKWRKDTFVPALRPVLEKKQGVTNRNRVYLLGGIVWSLATLTHPGDKTEFLKIDPKSIDDMLAKASTPDNDLCSDSRKNTYKDVNKVCNAFSPNQLIAGFQLMKGVSDELSFVKKKKTLFFFRPLYVWPLGYVSTRIHPDK